MVDLLVIMFVFIFLSNVVMLSIILDTYEELNEKLVRINSILSNIRKLLREKKK